MSDRLHCFCQTEGVFHISMKCSEVAVIHSQHIDKWIEVVKFFFGMDFQQYFHVEGMS